MPLWLGAAAGKHRSALLSTTLQRFPLAFQNGLLSHICPCYSGILLFFSAFLCWIINTIGSRNVSLFAVSISSYSLYHKHVNRGYTSIPFFLQRSLAVLRRNPASHNTASSKEINYWLNNAVIYLTSTLKHKDVKEHPVWTLILAAHSSLISQRLASIHLCSH